MSLCALAVSLLILLAGSTGICEPGDNHALRKTPGAASRRKQHLPKVAYEVGRLFMLQFSLLLTEGCKIFLGNIFLKGIRF